MTTLYAVTIRRKKIYRDAAGAETVDFVEETRHDIPLQQVFTWRREFPEAVVCVNEQVPARDETHSGRRPYTVPRREFKSLPRSSTTRATEAGSGYAAAINAAIEEAA